MIRSILSLVAVAVASQFAWSQQPTERENASQPVEIQAMRQRLASYVETFNSHDAVAVGKFWSADGVSIVEQTDERTEGREAIQQELAEYFKENPAVRLTGELTNVRVIRPDVMMIEGRTTLVSASWGPVESAFSAILVQEDGEWLISSSRERNLPAPATSYDALRELEWLIGTWEDQAEGAQVTTTVRWSPSQAFLIRSFNAKFGEDEGIEGTQIIGWDPSTGQIRTWTFNSDGSFSQGTVTKHDNDWMLKMSEVLSDGGLAVATKVLSRIDDDTFTVQTIGATLNGEPVPASEPVTVVRATAVTPPTNQAERGDLP